MSTATPAAQGRRIQGAIGAAREIRIIPRIDTYPRVIAFVQTSTGKAVLLALSTLGLRYFYQNAVAIPIMAAIAIITFKPEYRRLLLALAPIVRLILFARGGLLGRGANLAVIALGMTLYLCIMRWPKRWPKRWPGPCYGARSALCRAMFGLSVMRSPIELPKLTRISRSSS